MNNCKEYQFDDLMAITAIPIDDYVLSTEAWQLRPTIGTTQFSPTLSHAIVIGLQPATVGGILIPIRRKTGSAKDSESDSVAGRMHTVTVSCKVDDRNGALWDHLLTLERTPCHLLLTFRGGQQAFVAVTQDAYTCEIERSGSETGISFKVYNLMGIQLITSSQSDGGDESGSDDNPDDGGGSSEPTQDIPIRSFSVTGSDTASATGNYVYRIANILPSNYSRGIASLTASVSTPSSGSISISPNGTSGATLSISELPTTTQTVYITIKATLIGGGDSVTSTKAVSLVASSSGGGETPGGDSSSSSSSSSSGDNPSGGGESGADTTQFVDLGLPSGRLWAKGNIVLNGTTYAIGQPTDYGCGFSWGNIDGHSQGIYNFTEASYNNTPGKNLSGDISSSDAAHDAALARLGSPAHIPTLSDFEELFEYCNKEFTSVAGVYGMLFTSIVNGNTLFFPAASYYNGTSLVDPEQTGYYWSSTYFSERYAYCMMFADYVEVADNTESRYVGMPIRAVI